MEITQERVDAAYKVATDEQKRLLDALFGKQEPAKDDRPVTEMVKTFEDAVLEIGSDHEYIKALKVAEELGDDNLITFCRLRIITLALNEGWRPKFEDGEYRYYPYFWLYKDEEAAKKYANDDEVVKPIPDSVRCVLWGGAANSGASGGFAYAYSHLAPSSGATSIGFRLCFKNRDLAIYAGSQFAEDWLKFCCC